MFLVQRWEDFCFDLPHTTDSSLQRPEFRLKVVLLYAQYVVFDLNIDLLVLSNYSINIINSVLILTTLLISAHHSFIFIVKLRNVLF